MSTVGTLCSIETGLLIAGITEHEIMQAFLHDAQLVIFSVLLVWLYMWFHMTSVVLASLGVVQILFSVTVSYCIYRGVFGINYVGVLNALSLFIIFGIGADDIFILWDQWLLAAAIPRDERMAHVRMQAGSTMLITSLTTALAFASVAYSSIEPLHAFGVFSFVLVTVNYVLVMTWWTAAVVWYDSKVCNASDVVADASQGAAGTADATGAPRLPLLRRARCGSRLQSLLLRARVRISHVLNELYVPIVARSLCRRAVVMLFFGILLGGVCLKIATDFQLSQEQPALFSSEHNIQMVRMRRMRNRVCRTRDHAARDNVPHEGRDIAPHEGYRAAGAICAKEPHPRRIL